jgi:hypothetical protein
VREGGRKSGRGGGRMKEGWGGGRGGGRMKEGSENVRTEAGENTYLDMGTVSLEEIHYL